MHDLKTLFDLLKSLDCTKKQLQNETVYIFFTNDKSLPLRF